ncbi:hypothetical protein [Loktanella sp. M215]|nr:hypothetical protein [Loktanella sp. M215]MCF7699997.1 hypothetical protein [Loktanella sp. M215]
MTPGLQVLANFGIGLAMLASIASTRLEPLYTFLEIVMTDGACARMP